ncbi:MULTISPECIES: MFS transporter [Mycolicibacterium]|uniref:Integral membrane protein n=2 Tax=Mycolicibacterium TaxID=1866885 RepID=A0A378T0F1_9MYCO|nr:MULTISPECIES: MFS transporter [Mycolicibacterium]MCV7338464.1 MFS transporter [Mycolicibacterium senegalense]MCW1820889.1 MFS transporter [Mycolicibacterium senegalense]MDR7290336.1 MFS family permease [Mycolicibacterium senegalense]OBB14159.1 fucose permease [Mycolicibacterium conceptionense]OBF07281.1 fucose permease [Mycolicibacterium conceptionense]
MASRSVSEHRDTAALRRARVAVGALFLTNGAVFANLLPRYPEIKTDLHLGNAVYGAAVASFSGGALVAGLTAATLIRRFRSARVAVIGTVALAAFVVGAGVAGSPLMFAGALFLAGACDSVVDVAQNAHGLRLQREHGRSIINSLHAVWAAGAILGGLTGAAAIALAIPRGIHLAVVGGLLSAVALAAYRYLLPGPDHDNHPAAHATAGAKAGPRVYLILSALVLIAIAGATVEDSGSSWATLYLRDTLHAPPALAVFGYIALVAFMFVGRLSGDRLVDRFGEAAVARTGGVIAAAGMGCALAFPTVATTIAGFALAGLGVATLVPAAMHGADQLPGLRPGTGLTVVTWLMRVGFFGAPLLVGLVADAAGLRAGLVAVPVAGVLAALLAGVLPRKPGSDSVRRGDTGELDGEHT